jgi:DNA-binding transcriptional MerR regulator
MEVFVTWSGERSRSFASFLRDWLPVVIQAVSVFMSEEDVGKGQRWGAEITDHLGATNFGIVCLTPENLRAPWLLFEAGALAAVIDTRTERRMAPLLLGVDAKDVESPLNMFQHTVTTRDDVRRLVGHINDAIKDPVKREILDKLFEKMWPEFEKQVAELVAADAVVVDEQRPATLDDLMVSMRAQENSLLRLEHLISESPAVDLTQMGSDIDAEAGVASGEGRSENASPSGVVLGYRGPQVCKIVGITYRQLDYWARTGLVRPSVMDAGTGTQRLYSYRDLVELKVIKQMLDAGISLQSARKAVDALRAVDHDLASVRIVIQGPNIVLAESDEQVMDLLRGGQGVTSMVLEIEPLQQTVTEAVQLAFDSGDDESDDDDESGGLREPRLPVGPTPQDSGAGADE